MAKNMGTLLLVGGALLLLGGVKKPEEPEHEALPMPRPRVPYTPPVTPRGEDFPPPPTTPPRSVEFERYLPPPALPTERAPAVTYASLMDAVNNSMSVTELNAVLKQAGQQYAARNISQEVYDFVVQAYNTRYNLLNQRTYAATPSAPPPIGGLPEDQLPGRSPDPYVPPTTPYGGEVDVPVLPDPQDAVAVSYQNPPPYSDEGGPARFESIYGYSLAEYWANVET